MQASPDIAVGGALVLLPFLFVIFVGLVGTVLWIWMLVDCAINEPNEGNDKVVWVIIILLTHMVGALLYFFIRRPKRIMESHERDPGERM
jgi:hypothetical protein